MSSRPVLRISALRATLPLALVLLSACATPPPPTVQPSSRPTEVTSIAPAEWQRVALPAGDLALTSINALAVIPGGLVAAGNVGNGAGAWFSRDGKSWSAEPIPDGMAAPSAGIVWMDRTLFGGAGGSGRCAHPYAFQSWVRSATAQWTAAPFDDLFCLGGSPVLAANGQTAAVVGMNAGSRAFAWTSGDGLHWVDRSAVFGDSLPSGLAALGSGFIAVGWGDTGPWEALSVNGVDWAHPISLPASPRGAIPAGAVADGDRVVVFVTDQGGPVGVLRSADRGLTWSADRAAGLDGQTLGGVSSVADGFVAFGSNDAGPLLWASADGLAWTHVVLPTDANGSISITDAGISNGRAILVGQVEGAQGATGAIWIGPAQLLQP